MKNSYLHSLLLSFWKHLASHPDYISAQPPQKVLPSNSSSYPPSHSFLSLPINYRTHTHISCNRRNPHDFLSFTTLSASPVFKTNPHFSRLVQYHFSLPTQFQCFCSLTQASRQQHKDVTFKMGSWRPISRHPQVPWKPACLHHSPLAYGAGMKWNLNVLFCTPASSSLEPQTKSVTFLHFPVDLQGFLFCLFQNGERQYASQHWIQYLHLCTFKIWPVSE